MHIFSKRNMLQLPIYLAAIIFTLLFLLSKTVSAADVTGNNIVDIKGIPKKTTSSVLSNPVGPRPAGLDSDLTYYWTATPTATYKNSRFGNNNIQSSQVDVYANNLEGGVPGPNTTKLALVPNIESQGLGQDVRIFGMKERFKPQIDKRQAVMTNGYIDTQSVKATQIFKNNVVDFDSDGDLRGGKYWFNNSTPFYKFTFNAGDFDLAHPTAKLKDLNIGFRVLGKSDEQLYYTMFWYTGETPPPYVSSVTVHYVDQAGNKLADDIVLSGQVGGKYSTEEKQFNGYQLNKVVGNREGTYTRAPQEVTYVYSKSEIKPIIMKQVRNISKNEKNLRLKHMLKRMTKLSTK